MNRLGVMVGDPVLITGTRKTAAICLPMDYIHLPHDPEFEFVDNGGTRLPHARLSNIVSLNALGGSNLPLIQIEKTKARKSKTITLSPRHPLSFKKEHLELHGLIGIPFVTGDFIRARFIPSGSAFMDFFVSSSIPAECCSVITEDTEITITSCRPNFSIPSKLSGFKKTLPLQNKIVSESLEITIESIDLYDSGFRFFLVAAYLFDDQREWLGNKISLAALAFDDLGNSYACSKIERSQGVWTINGPQCSRLSLVMTPALNEMASRLTLVVNEITWNVRERKDGQVLDKIAHAVKHEPTVISVWLPQKAFCMIAAGPWSLDVDLHRKHVLR